MGRWQRPLTKYQGMIHEYVFKPNFAGPKGPKAPLLVETHIMDRGVGVLAAQVCSSEESKN